MEYNYSDITVELNKRIEFENTLIKKYNMPLVFIKVNYLGENRSNDITSNIIECMDEIVSDIFNPYIHCKILRATNEGPTLTLFINKNAVEIKKTTIDIENNHILGKCVNIDVYDEDTKKICRVDLGYHKTKCYLCNNTAEMCIKQKTHGQDEIIQYIVGIYRKYIEGFYGNRV